MEGMVGADWTGVGGATGGTLTGGVQVAVELVRWSSVSSVVLKSDESVWWIVWSSEMVVWLARHPRHWSGRGRSVELEGHGSNVHRQ